jgi:hypothetical protein
MYYTHDWIAFTCLLVTVTSIITLNIEGPYSIMKATALHTTGDIHCNSEALNWKTDIYNIYIKLLVTSQHIMVNVQR